MEHTAIRLSISAAHQLPGHQSGRDRLISALHGDAHSPVKVAGRWDADTFVTTEILDVFDEDEDCWASEYGFEPTQVA